MKPIRPNGASGHRMMVTIIASGRSSVSNVRIGTIEETQSTRQDLVTRDQGVNRIFMAIFFPIILIVLSALVHKYLLKENTHVLQDESQAARCQQGAQSLRAHLEGESCRSSTHRCRLQIAGDSCWNVPRDVHDQRRLAGVCDASRLAKGIRSSCHRGRKTVHYET